MKENNFDFRYPLYSIGFHSGWSNNDSPTSKLSLTKRKIVKLIEHSFKKISTSQVNLPPYFLKSSNGKIKGLSSGVGSSLISYQGEFFKIKRNGFKLEGFKKDIIPDREFIVNKNSLYEGTSREYGGAMSYNDAIREMAMEDKLSHLNFIIPQRTIALYCIEVPEKNDSVAMIQKIESDFRADELCMIILTNLFYEIFGKKCAIDLKKGEFQFPNYQINSEILHKIEKYESMLKNIAMNIGFIYRRFHDSGYLRGIGNSWYGNEIILQNGDIGSCDLESCFSLEEIGDPRIFKELAKTDIALVKTAFYDSMNFFDNSIASIIGVKLIEGFDQGYNFNIYKPLNKDDLIRNITQYLKKSRRIVNGRR